jgi:predicted DNA-binding transcriptional regulator AlpA
VTPEEGEGLDVKHGGGLIPRGEPGEVFSRLWDVEQVTAELRISRATLFAMLKAERFPKGFLLGRRRVWSAADVRAWVAEQALSAETKKEGPDDD